MRFTLVVFIFLAFSGTAVAAGYELTADETAVLKAMKAEDDSLSNLADIRAFAMAPWSRATQTGLVVAAAGSEADNFDVAVLKAKSRGWEVISAINTNNDSVIDPADAAALGNLAIDVIPYRISKDEVAFGVRANTIFSSTSTYDSSTSLHLFRLHNNQLEDIFAADVNSSECDKTSKNGKCGKENQFVIQFESTQHNGFYDILLKPAKGSTGTISRYIWREGSYINGNLEQK